MVAILADDRFTNDKAAQRRRTLQDLAEFWATNGVARAPWSAASLRRFGILSDPKSNVIDYFITLIGQEQGTAARLPRQRKVAGLSAPDCHQQLARLDLWIC